MPKVIKTEQDDSKYTQHQVKQAPVTPGMSVNQLVETMGGFAFGAGKLARAVDIYEEMMKDDVTKFMGLAGALVPGGMRRIIADMIRDGYVDVLVTTGANLVHDMIEALEGHHYLGSEYADDLKLKECEINRIFDVFLQKKHFTVFEEHLLDVLPGMDDGRMSIREFTTALGESISDPHSILRTAVDKEVPVYCPAIADSAIGLQAWLHKQTKPLQVDAFEDMREFMDICYNAKKLGAIILGGGVSKNYILQSMIVIPRGGIDYAIQITMDRPETGGVSGATLDEAKSWGKVQEAGRAVTVHADVTIALPVIMAALRERVEK